MKNQVILLMLLFLFLMPLVVGEIQTLGNFKKGECAILIQTCSNCSYINITSVNYPDSTQAMGEVEMIKENTYYTYEFCNTTEAGQYIVNGVGDIDGEDTIFVYDFWISPSGKSFSLGDVIIYAFFLILCLFSAYVSYKLIKGHPPSEDPLVNPNLYEIRKRSEFKFYLKILASKLWTVGVVMLYLTLLVFLILLNQLTYSLNLMELNEILKYAVIVFSWGMIPLILFWIGYLIITFYKAGERILIYQFGGMKQ